MRQRRYASCNHRFQPKRRHQRFCCRGCRLFARTQRRGHQRYCASGQRESERQPITCIQCGETMLFPPRRSTRRYCSNACRLRAFRHASRAEVARSERVLEHAKKRLRQQQHEAAALRMIWTRQKRPDDGK